VRAGLVKKLIKIAPVEERLMLENELGELLGR